MICKVRKTSLWDPWLVTCFIAQSSFLVVLFWKMTNLFVLLGGILGYKQDLLHMISRAGHTGHDACRNLHRLLKRKKALFPVDIDVAPITVAVRKPTYRTEKVWWPILKMSSWVEALCTKCPQMILGGHSLQDTLGWQSTLLNFWKRYQSFNGSHPIFQAGVDHRFVVPYFLHGDEGRGQCRRQFMVESFQPCISWKGTGHTNESG